MNTGAVLPEVQVTVRDIVAVLPQPSVAVNVLVWEREQPSLVTLPSVDVIVGLPQPAVAVAPLRAVVIAPAPGLQPRLTVE